MMKGKVLICLFVLLIVGVIVFFLFNKKGNNNPKELELTYTVSAGIPFKWEYEVKDEDVVSFDRSYVVKDENKNGKTGAPVTTNYVFKGLKEGKTTIVFKFVNFTTNEVSNTEEYEVIVDKDLNISLVEE